MSRGLAFLLYALLGSGMIAMAVTGAGIYWLHMPVQRAALVLGLPAVVIALLLIVRRRQEVLREMGLPPRGEEDHLQP